jgi:calcineurin-like phosphoesterase family protein
MTKIKDIFSKDKVFFTSDTHFFHKNIIEYCNRQFENSHEMNKTLIQNWNSTVPKDGIVFHLGDVSLTAKRQELINVLDQLNGDKYLIIGNHEADALKFTTNQWKGIYDILEIYVGDDEISEEIQHLVLCHYPMLTWNCSHKGSWNLFGHVHGGLKGKHNPNQMDVGVDTNLFFPYTWQEIKETITRQNLK